MNPTLVLESSQKVHAPRNQIPYLPSAFGIRGRASDMILEIVAQRPFTSEGCPTSIKKR